METKGKGLILMELNYVKEFLRLAETLNYAETADEFFISQPTLSRHIQLLEQELTAPLFIRTSRRVTLSPFGESFLPYARTLVQTQEQFTQELLVTARREKKVIICHPGAMGPYNVSAHLSRFQRENPDIQLEILGTAKQLDRLLNNDYDFLFADEGFLSCHTAKEPLLQSVILPWLTDRLVCVVRREHRLAGRDTVHVSDLRGERLRLHFPHHAKDSPFMLACQEAGFTPLFAPVGKDNMVETAAVGMIDAAVINGEVSLLSEKVAQYFRNDAVSILRLEPELLCEKVLIFRKSPALSPAEKRFLDFMTSIPEA